MDKNLKNEKETPKQIEPGAHPSMSIDAYHGDTEYLSSSSLKEFRKSPEHMKLYFSSPKERVAHFDFGNAFELYLCDRPAFEKEVFILDDTKIVSELRGEYKNLRASKPYKEWYGEEVAKAGNKYIIPKEGPDSMAKNILTT